jgi:hypothetical protein
MVGIESWAGGGIRRGIFIIAMGTAMVGIVLTVNFAGRRQSAGTAVLDQWMGTLESPGITRFQENSPGGPEDSKQGSLKLLTPSSPQASFEARMQARSFTMTELKSRHLFTMTIKLHPIQELGDTPAGNRRVVPVSGGTFTGDRLHGEILPNAGSDLLLRRADGTFQQDVRMVLRADDGSLILMTYRGVRYASEEVSARIARGETVPPSDYYLRTTPFFETSSPKFAWLNRIVTVGIGERRFDGVTYEIFEIL